MALRNFTRNLRMFRDIFELCKEKEKNNSSEKTVLKLWSQILSKMAVLVHEISLKKSARKKKHINLKNLKEQFFSEPFVGPITPFCDKSHTTLSKQFVHNF